MRPRSANPYQNHSLDEAIKTHTPLVKKIAHHIASRLSANVEVDDLIQEGMTGLLDALQRYEPQPNLSFEVYAKTRIRGAIYDSCRRNDILPRHQRDQITSLEKVTRSLEQKLGRPADDAEIAAEAGLSLEDYFETVGNTVNLMPLDDLPEEMMPSDKANDPMRLTSMKQLAKEMEAALKKLPEKEQLIMALHYQEELSYREIAVVMQLTPGRISQLHTQAIIRIRAEIKK